MDHFLYLCFLFVVCSCLFIGHSLVVTCLERAGLLALLCVMFYCVFVTFACDVLGQVWCLIVPISDLCLLSYFRSVGWCLMLVCSCAHHGST